MYCWYRQCHKVCGGICNRCFGCALYLVKWPKAETSSRCLINSLLDIKVWCPGYWPIEPFHFYPSLPYKGLMSWMWIFWAFPFLSVTSTCLPYVTHYTICQVVPKGPWYDSYYLANNLEFRYLMKRILTFLSFPRQFNIMTGQHIHVSKSIKCQQTILTAHTHYFGI